MTKVFLDNAWVDFDYSTLYYTRGITDTPSTMLSILDEGMSPVEGWFNSGYVWITQDILWYPEEEVPYYVRQESPDHLYYIDSLLSIPVFKKEGELFDLYQDSFYSKESLFTQFGLTETPSQVWDIDAGVPWSWYNPGLGMYWDDRNGRKYWSTEPPIPKSPDDSDKEILPFPDPVIPLYQWEEDLSQLPTIQSVTGRFFPAPSVYTSLSPSHKMIEQWDDSQNLVNDLLYNDVTQTGINIYVQAEEGVDDYLGNHHNFGDYFVGDYQHVYVESDSDDTLYLGTQPIVIPRSHDDYNPVLYYFNDEYVTPTHLHDLGYTNTYSSEVEIFDYSLLDLPDSINVILYLKYDRSIASFKKVKFEYDSPDNWWWSCVRQEDQQAIIDFGLLIQNTSPWGGDYFGTIGNIVWNRAVIFEVLSLYEDINTPLSIDLTQFRTIQDTQYDTNLLGIECLNKIYDQEFIAWKCRITKLHSIDIVLGIRYQPSSGPWLAKTFAENEWWWSGILSQEDAATVQTFGAGLVTHNDSSTCWSGPIGALGYNSSLHYDIIAFYSDLGETEVSFDRDNFYLRGATTDDTSYYPGSVLVCSIGSYSTPVMSYKVRVTRS